MVAAARSAQGRTTRLTSALPSQNICITCCRLLWGHSVDSVYGSQGGPVKGFYPRRVSYVRSFHPVSAVVAMAKMGSSALLLLSLALDGAAALALDGQRVVVTGGGRGIGKALALLCAEEGAEVAILARTQLELESVVKEATTRGVPTPLRMRTTDVTDEASVDAALRTMTPTLTRTRTRTRTLTLARIQTPFLTLSLALSLSRWTPRSPRSSPTWEASTCC